jgi:4'-phosphopantetheinyl transferase EntD
MTAPRPQGRVKVVVQASELRECAKDALRRGGNMAVLSGASNRQATPTWPEGRC